MRRWNSTVEKEEILHWLIRSCQQELVGVPRASSRPCSTESLRDTSWGREYQIHEEEWKMRRKNIDVKEHDFWRAGSKFISFVVVVFVFFCPRSKVKKKILNSCHRNSSVLLFYFFVLLRLTKHFSMPCQYLSHAISYPGALLTVMFMSWNSHKIWEYYKHIMLRASLVSEKNVYFPQATRERERERSQIHIKGFQMRILKESRVAKLSALARHFDVPN